MKKTPKFFCDNCGTEVENNAKACPHCGRFFSSVRCPACGFSGEDRLFLRGCPSCGYSTPPEKGSSLKVKKRFSFSLAPKAYFITVIVLLIVVMVLAFVITR